MTTYVNCKKVIENAIYKSTGQKEEMQNKLDVFLLNNRLNQEEYEELTELLNQKPIAN